MHLKEIDRTARVAWGPALRQSPLLATGTVSGALDASFSTNTELEIYDLAIQEQGTVATKKASISTTARFNRLVWSLHNSVSPEGIIAGGLEDGSISFWNAHELLNGGGERALIARKENHKGSVRGLQFNPFQPFLMASGASDAEIWLWDLNSLSKPYAPGAAKSQKLEDVTDIAWNHKVPHILAASSNTGYTVIWDLKNRKEVIQLASPGGRRHVSAIAWNPENPTHILTASEDDNAPVILSWDLRNAHSPEKTLTGHSKGVLSIAWCPKDSDLLLSSGKDNRTLCWNPKSGEVIGELPHHGNWTFDVQWCPRNPDMLSTASFDGKVQVFSFQGLSGNLGNQGGSATANPAAQASSMMGGAGDFYSQVATANATTDKKAAAPMRQVPKWLRRPIGASFGFGGRLVLFSNSFAPRAVVSIVSNSLTSASSVVQESLKLETALAQGKYTDFCASKIARPVNSLRDSDGESVLWYTLKVLLESESHPPQLRLLSLLGFDNHTLAEHVSRLRIGSDAEHQMRSPAVGLASRSSISGLSRSRASSILASPAGVEAKIDEVDFFAGDSSHMDGSFDFSSAIQPAAAAAHMSANPALSNNMAAALPPSQPFALFAPDSSECDRLITQAIILGNFESAVDICVRAKRLSDALLVAICGGEDLVARTQQLYFQKAQHPYLRIVSAIVKRDMADIVENAYLTNWEEILALLCSFTSGAEFSRQCEILAGRLERTHDAAFELATMICYLAAGNASKAAAYILSQAERRAPTMADYYGFAAWLEDVVEKIRLVERAAAANGSLAASSPELAMLFARYASFLASQGMLDLAGNYYSQYCTAGNVATTIELATFADRLYHSLSNPATLFSQAPPRPFAQVNVIEHAAPNSNNFVGGNSSYGSSPAGGFANGGSSEYTGGQHMAASFAVPSWQSQQPKFAPNNSTYGGIDYSSSQNMHAASIAGGNNPYQAVNARDAVAPSPYAAAASTMSSSSYTASGAVMSPPSLSSVGSNYQQQPAYLANQPPNMYSQQSTMLNTNTGYPQSHHPSGQQYSSQQQQSAYTVPPAVATPPAYSHPQAPATPQLASMIPTPYASMMSASSSQSSVSTNARTDSSSLPGHQRVVTGFNDPPIIAPRQAAPAAQRLPPITAPILNSAPAPIPQNPQYPPSLSSMDSNASSTRGGMAAAATAVAPAEPEPVAPPAKKEPAGPVELSSIPDSFKPIFQTFSALINFCQQRASPMQRRIVEDSTKRMQSLFWQLSQNELTPTVTDQLHRMCQAINNRQLAEAYEMHLPLMTSHFGEVGAWILAAKRLLEVAKVC